MGCSAIGRRRRRRRRRSGAQIHGTHYSMISPVFGKPVSREENHMHYWNNMM
jgi:hypothetical protein